LACIEIGIFATLLLVAGMYEAAIELLDLKK
jgi:hypothetical protein